MEKGDGIEIRKNGIDHSTQMLRAFAHFTLSMYDGKAMACDLQGVGYDVTDQQISHPVKGTFASGNMEDTAARQFKRTRTCNRICRQLRLKAVNKNRREQTPAALGRPPSEDAIGVPPSRTVGESARPGTRPLDHTAVVKNFSFAGTISVNWSM